jgi:hypothetical protein
MTLLCAKKRDGRSFQRRLFAAFGFHGGIFAQEDVDTYLVADKQARYGQGMSEERERERKRKRERRKNLRILAYMKLHLGSYLFGLSPGRREKKKKNYHGQEQA